MNKTEQEYYNRAIETGNRLQKQYETIHNVANEYLGYINTLINIDKAEAIDIQKVKEMLSNICKL